MGLEEDKKEIMDAVKDALMAAMDHHRANCPAVGIIPDLVRIKKDLYNGDDKPGFIEDARTFFTEQRTSAKIRADNRKWALGIGSIAVVFIGTLLAPSLADGWAATKSLMQLANKAPEIIKLTDDWKRYYDNPPAPPLPAPVKPKHSFFEQRPSRDTTQNAQLPNLR